MTAALRVCLVLDMTPGGAGAFQLPDGACDRGSGGPPAGVGIHEHRQLCCSSDAPQVLADVSQGGQTQIRQSEGSIGYARTGKVQRPETSPLGQQGAIGMMVPANCSGRSASIAARSAAPGLLVEWDLSWHVPRARF